MATKRSSKKEGRDSPDQGEVRTVEEKLPEEKSDPGRKPTEEEQLESGNQHFEAFRAEVEALEEAPRDLPRVNIYRIVDRLEVVNTDLVNPVIRLAVAKYKKEEADQVLRCHQRLEPLRLTLFFVKVMLDNFGDVVGAATFAARRQQLLEARRLNKIGRYWLVRLRGLQIIGADQADRVLKGSGTADLAGDLQTYGVMYQPLWPVIDQLQEIRLSEAEKKKGTPGGLNEAEYQELTDSHLDEQMIARMGVVGTNLIKGKQAAEAEQLPGDLIDWKRQLIGTYALLEREYHIVRVNCWAYYQLNSRFGEADALLTFNAMNAAGRSPGKSSELDEPVDEPKEPEEPLSDEKPE